VNGFLSIGQKGCDHEKGEKGLPDSKQVVVGWLPFGGGEGVCVCVELSSG
jgi:hypothetical protein